MATFKAQVEGLTSLSLDGSSAPTQTELTQFLTDGAKEIINSFPQSLLELCCAQQTFTSTVIGSESETLSTGKVLRVFRNNGEYDVQCRFIDSGKKGYATDRDEINYATITDPVFYIENNKLNALPNGGSCKYDEVQYPAVAHGDAAIGVFPDEAEHLVVLYGAIKSLQNVLGNKSSNSDITTALTAINTEVDECIALADLINTQVDSAVSELAEAATNVDSSIDTAVAAITTALGRVNTAVALANTEFDLVNAEVDLANAEVDNDDVEIARGYIETANGYANAGQKYLDEASLSLSEANGYANEVTSRTSHVSAQVNVASGYISAAQGYATEITSKINIAGAYSKEVESRLTVDAAQYGWYEKQQAKLQADYDNGLQKLIG